MNKDRIMRICGLFDDEKRTRNAYAIFDKNGLSPTLDTMQGGGRQPFIIQEKEMDNLKIRKLTPKECFRLMGVKDEDYENAAKNQSDSSLYHLAGDSIVVNVLMAIFKQLLEGVADER